MKRRLLDNRTRTTVHAARRSSIRIASFLRRVSGNSGRCHSFFFSLSHWNRYCHCARNTLNKNRRCFSERQERASDELPPSGISQSTQLLYYINPYRSCNGDSYIIIQFYSIYSYFSPCVIFRKKLEKGKNNPERGERKKNDGPCPAT